MAARSPRGALRAPNNREGFALGSIEGRVAIHHVEPKNASRNFAFKARPSSHRGFVGLGLGLGLGFGFGVWGWVGRSVVLRADPAGPMPRSE